MMEITNTDTTNRPKGVDVSHHNGLIDWQKVKAAGYSFAFLKATEGGDWIDKNFARNRKAARDAGIELGYYHFFRPSTAVELQVRNFVKVVGELESDALCPVLDVEDPRIWKDYSKAQRVLMITQWCQGVKAALGLTPMLYGSPSFFNEILENAPELAAYDLWIANYKVDEPNVPQPWTNWTFWQHSETGKVPGINGDVDLNLFNGSDLAKARHRKDESNTGSDEISLPMRIFWYTAVALYFVGLLVAIWLRLPH